MNDQEFIDLIWQQGRELYRTMPWREDTRPYYVLVSELMLQQTQVDRVIPKFQAFILAFPDATSLAQASLAEVLKLWQGLGYNRRAKFLHEAAHQVTGEHGGVFPSSKHELMELPGVGPNTAGAILNYAFNEPTVFIETNIRTVYFHHYFPDGAKVTDGELIPILERTLDHEHPREFYWALMDYGSWLKKQGVGRISQSHHYRKQTPLKGSVREVRGRIIKRLSAGDTRLDVIRAAYDDDPRFATALSGLIRDGLVRQTGDQLHLTK